MAVKSQPAVTELHVPELEIIHDEVEQALGAEKAQKLRQVLHSYRVWPGILALLISFGIKGWPIEVPSVATVEAV